MRPKLRRVAAALCISLAVSSAVRALDQPLPGAPSFSTLGKDLQGDKSTATVLIPGTSAGTITGVLLAVNDQVTITATGTVSTLPPGSNGGPDGNPAPCNSDCLLPSAHFAALIGRISTDGPWFLVGSRKVFTANRAGVLILAINDSIHDDNTGSFNATVDVVGQPPGLSLTRLSLMAISAQAAPPGGAFSYTMKKLSGTNVAGIGFAPGVNSRNNPNESRLSDPSNPSANGAPVQGGLAQATVTYTTVQGSKLSKRVKVPTFGMSCYYTTTESEWGLPPAHCKTLRLNGVVYSGTVTNPAGLTGVYCSSFIAEVKLQGSAYTNDNRKIQYDPSTKRIRVVSVITGADGTAVIAGKSLARDRKVIPKGGVLVSVDGIGSDLIANDTGGKIIKYRLDLYNGAGKGACSNFNNIISVAACVPGNALCPASSLPQ